MTRSTRSKHTIFEGSEYTDDLIPLREAAAMLGLDPSTIRKRAAGTAYLTLIPQGRKLFLVFGEVVAYRRKLIEDARNRKDTFTLVYGKK